MAVVETRDLCKRYRLGREDVIALDGVSIHIESGEFLSVMGRSGSGKSTLLHLIGCLDRPTSGMVLLGDLEASALPEHRLPQIRRERIGFVFQHFNLIPTLTAMENVMLPLKYAGENGKEARSRAVEILASVEMDHRLKHRPTELSGGEQQRVAIARALVNRPSVVLADEPTGDMDTKTAADTVGLMRRINEERGHTFILVTHDPLVADQTDRIVRLSDGKVESDDHLAVRASAG